MKKIREFKCLGATLERNGDHSREVKKRIQAGWNNWRRVSGVIGDSRVPAPVKGKVYKSFVRPAMIYCSETATLPKKQESELEVAELRMFRFSMSVTGMVKIKKMYMHSSAHVR